MPIELQTIPFALIALIVMGIGFLNCFFGFRVIRSAFALWGVAAGIYIGLTLMPAGDTTLTTLLIVAVIGGIIGGVIFVILYLIGAVAIGVALGFTLSLVVMRFLGMEPNLIINVIFAMLFGFMALFLNRMFIIISTAFAGASAIVLAGAALFYDQASLLNMESGNAVLEEAQALPPFLWILWILLGLIGMFVQFRMTDDD